MYKLFAFLSILILSILTITACGSSPTPTQPTVNLPTQTLTAPTATTVQQVEPTSTPAAQVEITPTSEPTQTEVPTEAVPSPTPTETPSEEAPPPTPTETGSSSADTGNPADENTPAEDCTNKAAFFDDVTIPDDTGMLQGQTFTKTWRIRNEGTCTWQGYKLIYAGGEAMNANPSNDIQSVEPGAIADFSVDMQAPNRGGSHTSFWQFSTDTGTNFGVGASADGLLWVRITVDYGSQTDSPTGSSQTTATTTSTSTAGCSYETNSGYINTILELVNKARSSAGLKTLVLEDRLSAAAQEHSADMACNDFISHTGSDGSLWYQRVSAQGYANSNSARENIYVGNPAFGGDAQGAFDWWMNSQIHRDNILNNGVTQIGIAYAYYASSSYGGYYTLVLARP